MNWSQRLLLVQIGAVAGFVLSIVGFTVGVSMDSNGLMVASFIFGTLSLVTGFTAILIAKILFQWHKEGSVGSGTRVWHD